jgi:hypothetical protein
VCGNSEEWKRAQSVVLEMIIPLRDCHVKHVSGLELSFGFCARKVLETPFSVAGWSASCFRQRHAFRRGYESPSAALRHSSIFCIAAADSEPITRVTSACWIVVKFEQLTTESIRKPERDQSEWR